VQSLYVQARGIGNNRVASARISDDPQNPPHEARRHTPATLDIRRCFNTVTRSATRGLQRVADPPDLTEFGARCAHDLTAALVLSVPGVAVRVTKASAVAAGPAAAFDVAGHMARATPDSAIKDATPEPRLKLEKNENLTKFCF